MQEQTPDYEAILGPHEVGVMVSIFLFGMVTIQTFTYYREYSKDTVHLKTLVSIIFCCQSPLNNCPTWIPGWFCLVCSIAASTLFFRLMILLVAGFSCLYTLFSAHILYTGERHQNLDRQSIYKSILRGFVGTLR
jgi:hypothetical protein